MTEEEKKEKKEKRRTADYLWYLHVTGEWVLLLFAACNGFSAGSRKPANLPAQWEAPIPHRSREKRI
jgi:hypothetical protein